MPDDARGAGLSERFSGGPEIGEQLATLRGERLRELGVVDADDDVSPPRRRLPERAAPLGSTPQRHWRRRGKRGA
jgi:hypothetical protein